jgi:hypothetical protein
VADKVALAILVKLVLQLADQVVAPLKQV